MSVQKALQEFETEGVVRSNQRGHILPNERGVIYLFSVQITEIFFNSSDERLRTKKVQDKVTWNAFEKMRVETKFQAFKLKIDIEGATWRSSDCTTTMNLHQVMNNVEVSLDAFLACCAGFYF